MRYSGSLRTGLQLVKHVHKFYMEEGLNKETKENFIIVKTSLKIQGMGNISNKYE